MYFPNLDSSTHTIQIHHVSQSSKIAAMDDSKVKVEINPAENGSARVERCTRHAVERKGMFASVLRREKTLWQTRRNLFDELISMWAQTLGARRYFDGDYGHPLGL
jgi:hypothetical protein